MGGTDDDIDLTAEGQDRTSNAPRALLVDDHALLVEGLAVALRREGVDVEVAPGFDEDTVVEAAQTFQPDVVLLDLMLGDDAKGLDLIAPIRQVADTAILMLTGVTNRVELAECLEAGADGLASKSQAFPEIVDLVTATAEGKQAMRDHDRASMLAELFRHREEERERLRPFEDLTPREQEVLAGLIDGHSPQEIADEAYVSVGTVRTQIKVLYRKLGVGSQIAAVAAARAAGWAPERVKASR